MAETLYSLDILRLAAATARWPMPEDAQGRAERRSPTCGSRVAVGVLLDDAGRIEAIGFDISACALGQASAVLLASAATGRTCDDIRFASGALSDWLTGASGIPPAWPGIEALAAARDYPARHPSILLGFLAAADAAQAARGGARRAHG